MTTPATRPSGFDPAPADRHPPDGAPDPALDEALEATFPASDPLSATQAVSPK
jgi:hypothetical protein